MKRDIELLLLKLADGGRILRLSEPRSGLCLEKRLDDVLDTILRTLAHRRRDRTKGQIPAASI